MKNFNLALVLCSIYFLLIVIDAEKNGTLTPQFFNLNLPEISNEKNVFQKREDENVITILFGGDVMLGRMVMQTAIKNEDYSYPFNRISDTTKDADLFFVNLENPIIKDCPDHFGGFKFCSPPEMIEGLKTAGVKIVSLANNHIGNYGQKGIQETKDYLENSGILISGLGNLTAKKTNNITVGFLGFDFTVKSPTEKDYLLIVDSDIKVDYLVVSVHWGEEYKAEANFRQRDWAKKMVNMGADIIIGHHPHWVQDYECIKLRDVDTLTPTRCDGITGKPVYYSLGNLVFDQMWSEETKRGMLVKFVIGEKGIVSQELMKTYMTKLGQPEVVEIISNNYQ